MQSKTVENLQEQVGRKQKQLLDLKNITVKNNNHQAATEYGGRPSNKHSNSMIFERTESEKNLKHSRGGVVQ